MTEPCLRVCKVMCNLKFCFSATPNFPSNKSPPHVPTRALMERDLSYYADYFSAKALALTLLVKYPSDLNVQVGINEVIIIYEEDFYIFDKIEVFDRKIAKSVFTASPLLV